MQINKKITLRRTWYNTGVRFFCQQFDEVICNFPFLALEKKNGVKSSVKGREAAWRVRQCGPGGAFLSLLFQAPFSSGRRRSLKGEETNKGFLQRSSWLPRRLHSNTTGLALTVNTPFRRDPKPKTIYERQGQKREKGAECGILHCRNCGAERRGNFHI